MHQKRITLYSPVDQLPLSVLYATPEKKPRAIIQFLHGMSEHKERYLPVIEYFVKEGYICVIHDHRGHGLSVKGAQDLGFFYQGGSEGLIEDARLINKWIREKYIKLPIFIIAHSMGTLIARAFMQRGDQMLSGVILCGSPSNNRLSRLASYFVKLLCILQGEHERSFWVERRGILDFNQPFLKEKSLYAWICSNKEAIELYEQDALCGFTFTNNGYYHLFRLVSIVYDYKQWGKCNSQLPILFLSGENDSCMVSKEKLFKSMHVLTKAGYKNLTYHIYTNMRHEILNENKKEVVYENIKCWMRKCEKTFATTTKE